MPKHKVKFSLPENELLNSDANFQIYIDDEKLGTITISKGGLDYYPKNKKTPIKVSWTKFDKLLQGIND